MNIFRNLNMGMKLGLGFGCILLLVCVLGAMVYKTLLRNTDDADIIAEQYIPAIVLTTKMQQDFDSAVLAIRGYTNTRAESEYTTAISFFETVQKNLDALKKHADDFGSMKRCREFIAVFPDFFKGYVTQSEETRKQILAESRLNAQMTTLADAADKALSVQVEEMVQLAESTIGSGEGLSRTALANMERAQQVRILFLILRRNITAASVQNDIKLLQAASSRMEELDTIMDVLRTTAVSRRSQEVVDATREQLEEYHTSMGVLESLWGTLHGSEQKRRELHTSVSSELSKLSEDGFFMTQRQTSNTLNSTKESSSRISILIVTVLVLGILIALFLARIMTKPLRLALDFAQGVANGNLNQELDVHSTDEIGKMCDALRTMVHTLKQKIEEANQQSLMAQEKERDAVEAMKQAELATRQAERAKSEGMTAAAMRLEGTVSSMSSALSQLSAQISQSERGAATQASRVTETVTAMEEMTSTVIEVAKNAGAASDISKKTREKALEGSEVVQNAVEGILRVQKGALAMREDMSTLDQHSKAISQIMGVISDIADQTNLLALNAAIEAARAGEAGRGFAVVADEVRKLAEKTMSSTTDVGNAIRAIQQSAERSMARVEETVNNVEECSAGSMRSGTALKEIVSLADQTADQVQAIATASEQQSATSEEINRSVEHVNSIAGETAVTMKEAACAVNELAGQAEDLSRLVEELKRS